MAYHPFGIVITEGGAPKSELTRRVLKNVLDSKKVQKDAAGNDDAVFNASNVKATWHDPTGTTNSANRPESNEDDFSSADSVVQQWGGTKVQIVKGNDSVNEDRLDAVMRSAMTLKKKIKKILKDHE